jgi:hypothetical protein
MVQRDELRARLIPLWVDRASDSRSSVLRPDLAEVRRAVEDRVTPDQRDDQSRERIAFDGLENAANTRVEHSGAFFFW